MIFSRCFVDTNRKANSNLEKRLAPISAGGSVSNGRACEDRVVAGKILSLLKPGKLPHRLLQRFRTIYPGRTRVIVGPAVGEDAAIIDMGDRCRQVDLPLPTPLVTAWW
jgi:hypothetical protein